MLIYAKILSEHITLFHKLRYRSSIYSACETDNVCWPHHTRWAKKVSLIIFAITLLMKLTMKIMWQ